MLLLRSLIFNIFLYTGIVTVFIIALPTLFLPAKFTLLFGKFLGYYVIFILRIFLNTRVEFKGVENIPKNEKYKHNATRTFQAIRIFINKELEVLREALNYSYDILAPRGRLVLITYHSLEDRVIKNFIAVSDENLSTPKDLPIKSDFLKKMFNVVAKSIKPEDDEVIHNPRSRSAKLNILEKNDEDYD